MIQLSKLEESVIQNLTASSKLLVRYTQDNKIEISKTENPLDKKVYNPIVDMSARDLELAKAKGITSITNHPFKIQATLQSAKTNRFRRLPVVALGVNPSGDLFYYEAGSGRINGINLVGLYRMPTKKLVVSDSKIKYQAYSFFNSISIGNISDKNYSLKLLSYILTQGYKDLKLIEINHALLKGLLITNKIKPDLILTIKSSKPVNDDFLDAIKKDKFYSDADKVMVEKPSYSALKKFYFANNYNYDLFIPKDPNMIEMAESDFVSLKILNRIDRKSMSRVLRDYMQKQYDLDKYEGTTIIVFDDTMTTGSTMKNILIPLVNESKNTILPISLILK